jgi:hypothetical protein
MYQDLRAMAVQRPGPSCIFHLCDTCASARARSESAHWTKLQEFIILSGIRCYMLLLTLHARRRAAS